MNVVARIQVQKFVATLGISLPWRWSKLLWGKLQWLVLLNSNICKPLPACIWPAGELLSNHSYGWVEYAKRGSRGNLGSHKGVKGENLVVACSRRVSLAWPDSPYILPSSERMIFRRPHGGYIASASWKLCSMSGLHTPSASAADMSCECLRPQCLYLGTDNLAIGHKPTGIVVL